MIVRLGSLPKSSLSWLRRRRLRKLGNSVGLQTRSGDEAGQTGNQQGSGKSPVLTGVLVHLFNRFDPWKRVNSTPAASRTLTEAGDSRWTSARSEQLFGERPCSNR